MLASEKSHCIELIRKMSHSKKTFKVSYYMLRSQEITKIECAIISVSVQAL